MKSWGSCQLIRGLYFYSVPVLILLVAVVSVACGGGQAVAPGEIATKTHVDAQTTMSDPTSIVASQAIATPIAPSASTSPKTMPDASSADQQAAVYEALLATIPDGSELRQDMDLRIFNYALARQIFPPSTFPLPGPGDDEDTLAAFDSWTVPLAMVLDDEGIIYPTVASLPNSPFFPRSHHSIDFRYFAFDIRNIDQSIAVNTTGRSRYDIARGRFDPQAAEATLKTCVECPAPSIEEYKGITYYGWGEDYAVNPKLKLAPPAFDELGRGGRIAVLEEYVIRTLGTPDMKAAIDGHLKQAPSLADVEEFQLLVKSMSRLGVHAMFLSDSVENSKLSSDYAKLVAAWDASQTEVEAKEQELLEAGPWLRPYDAVGVGFGKDEEGRFIALVLVHKGGDFAEENVGLLRRIIEEENSVSYPDMKWSEYIDINSLEINAEGRLLLAKMRGDIDSSGLDWVYRRDNLILYEQK